MVVGVDTFCEDRVLRFFVSAATVAGDAQEEIDGNYLGQRQACQD